MLAQTYGTQFVSVGSKAGGPPVGEKRYPMQVKYHGILLGKQARTLHPFSVYSYTVTQSILLDCRALMQL